MGKGVCRINSGHCFITYRLLLQVMVNNHAHELNQYCSVSEQEMCSTAFGGKKLSTTMNAEECVARGAGMSSTTLFKHY